jgi:hypothetical protein
VFILLSPTRATILALLVLLSFAACGDDDPEVAACNLHGELCDRPLNEVAFATTHNSMSNLPDRWIDPTQSSGIAEQLNAGIRGFQVDSYYGVDVGPVVLTSAIVRTEKMNEELSGMAISTAEQLAGGVSGLLGAAPPETYLCHGNCELGAIKMDDALRQFTSFLQGNPNEVLIIFIEDYISAEDTEAALEESGLADYVYTHDGGEWPTLREMIEDGTRVLVMSERGGGEPAWYHKGFELTQETPYRFESVEEMSGDSSCVLNRGKEDSPLFQLNHFISPASQGTSEAVNEYQFLLERAQRCQEERGMVPNLVAVNFWGVGSVVDVVDEINGVR